MGKAAFWQRGETIDYTNGTTDAIEANTIIIFGNRIGVAGTDILPGETGSLHVTGVFEFPKSSGAGEIAAGSEVYYSESGGGIVASPGVTAASADSEDGETIAAVSNVKAGFAVSGAASGSNTVLVKINA